MKEIAPVQNDNIPPDASLTETLARVACLRDYEVRARQLLPRAIWSYLQCGAADGITSRWNEQALQDLPLWPRMLRGVANGSTALELLGRHHASPILIAPMAYHALAHRYGELATSQAAGAMQTGLVVSTQSSVSLEEVARNAHAPLWFQLYIQPHREITLDLIGRAERAGYQALVVTVDAPIQGLRNADQRAGFQLPPEARPVNLEPYAQQLNRTGAVEPGQSVFRHPLVAAMPDWASLAWLVRQTSLPVLVKGLIHPGDVEPALDCGIDGIIVSNHGGRMLDGVPATVHVLPGIVAAVGQRVPVLVDGGIRRGTDIIKCLARGADAVLVGRPVLHGLAVAGSTGVAHVLHLLRTELEMGMVLCGAASIADIRELGLLDSRMHDGGAVHAAAR
ncbi:alpha-hydroxy-acid oxidizing protein [Corticibacter populi]|uniref:Alpha-hydroxy-acid oxidizing protein n=1 Tax=Corticibacter populi TaxID=1550736 RepID=A0A3M6QXV7_9BURK|nr:alpha-hydroxy acid oxidase [Corticibacter populi]RMX07855.1 alpha-hydroxy-acid oxidizing protein [Corticibacter populi]RZS35089.1 4-hydroxymandelate oxidase [Corticibacter populi]